jgi:RF-1 domain
MMHPAALPINDLHRLCDVKRTRRGGPGGQHRNKVETAVVVTHRPTGLTGQAAERRSQDLNFQEAIHRLRVQLALEVRTAVQGDAPPSKLWRLRVRSRKLVVSVEHDDFPALLAEALDRLAACEWDAATAATELGLTTTQLVKLMKLEPRAFGQLNSKRLERRLKPLQ